MSVENRERLRELLFSVADGRHPRVHTNESGNFGAAVRGLIALQAWGTPASYRSEAELAAEAVVLEKEDPANVR